LERRLPDAQKLFYAKDQIQTSWWSKMPVKFQNFLETQISENILKPRKVINNCGLPAMVGAEFFS
jgi:hypothetical protein